MDLTGWDAYRDVCAAIGETEMCDAHDHAIRSLRGQNYLLQYFRHPVVVRRPSLAEWSEHQRIVQTILEDYKSSERVSRVTAENDRFARACTAYPDERKLSELEERKMNLLDDVYRLIHKIVDDSFEVDALKLCGQ